MTLALGYAPQLSRCESRCWGRFPADGGAGFLACGRDPGVLATAMVEMVTVLLNGAFRLVDHISAMIERGVDAERLSGTIQTFIDMGKPFAHPLCAVEGA